MRTYSDEPGEVWDDNDVGPTLPTSYRQWCLVCGVEIDLVKDEFDRHLFDEHHIYYDSNIKAYVQKGRTLR